MAIYRTDNPDADFAAWDADQCAQLERLPKCDYCGETIQDDFYFDLDGCITCEECVNKNFRKSIDDFI